MASFRLPARAERSVAADGSAILLGVRSGIRLDDLGRVVLGGVVDHDRARSGS